MSQPRRTTSDTGLIGVADREGFELRYGRFEEVEKQFWKIVEYSLSLLFLVIRFVCKHARCLAAAVIGVLVLSKQAAGR